MKKLILLVLVGSLLLISMSSCLPNDKNEGTTPDNTTETIELNPAPNTPIPTGELDKNSDLVVALTAYLKQSVFEFEYNIFGISFSQKINGIKNGAQPIHVAFDPTNYYFVGAYYNPTHEYSESLFCCAQEYTWIAYKNETEIQECYNDMKCIAAFQINRALTVTNLLPDGTTTPGMEHFQIYKSTFENGVNVGAPIVFDETFIYLNNFINHFDEDMIYHSKSAHHHSNQTIPCVNLDGRYYLPFYLYTIYTDGHRGEEKSYVNAFGEYYDALTSIMEKDKYSITKENGRTSFYGVISLEDFVNGVVK